MVKKLPKWSCDTSTSNLHWLSNDANIDSDFLTCPQFKYIEKQTFRSFQILKEAFYNFLFIVWRKNLDLFWVNTGLDKALQPGYNWFGSDFFYFHSNWLFEDCFKFITIQNHVYEHCSSYNLFVKHDFGEWSMFGRPIQRLNTSYSFL